ncbi:flagellar motor protein MotB [Arenibaculum pallidiluteum]|uniref:flagellar motor protein MotB n=1 Tax=Arenibaculum pallidiluteum TaxID=2812559 RepID=UPI001A97222C|nr:flagellar motor protein MotB [Arenibaculum pallidiluteum]
MAAPNKDTPIILRRRGGEHEEHEEHGGTWKIAYADFVTAMMTFFLLMWLLSVTTPEQRNGLAEYFNPVAVSQEHSGADGILAGRSVDDSGSLTSPHAEGTRSIPVAAPPVVASVGKDDRNPAGVKDPMAAPPPSPGRKAELRDLLNGGAVVTAGVDDIQAYMNEREAAAQEQRSFERLEREIARALSAPDLRGVADSLVVQQVPEGMRIQITDRPQFSMFAVGSAQMNEKGRRLMQALSTILASVPNGIAISGHTDGLAYGGAAKYGNWELSSDRANAARRELLAAGLPPSRIKRVEGRADLDHLESGNPLDPRNRRIGLTLLRQVPAESPHRAQ